MAPFRRWADLPLDLLSRIGDRLDLKWYARAQGACTAWRCALAPPSLVLLVVSDDSSWCLHVASLPTRRSFEVTAIVSGSCCVGSSKAWLADQREPLDLQGRLHPDPRQGRLRRRRHLRHRQNRLRHDVDGKRRSDPGVDGVEDDEPPHNHHHGHEHGHHHDHGQDEILPSTT